MEQNTALLIMDMQVAVLAGLKDTKSILNNVAAAIRSAREKKIPVIYAVVGFRPGAPEVSLHNKIFGGSKHRYSAPNMDELMKVHPDIAPLSHDIIVNKRRVSAFTGSDLEIVLRAQGIQHIVLAGVSTSGVVLSTLREAADKDYLISVLADCCEDADEEVHQVLMNKVFIRQAEVITLKDWLQK